MAKTKATHDIPACYRKLLKVTRFRKSKADRIPTPSIEAASDRGRVLFSNAFRRLQSKTQVFDQESNASVRTRLTHSLEVATVGRYIAEVCVKEMVKSGWLGSPRDEGTLDMAAAVVTFVEVACLMHDLGNPPFGHFGEGTIQTWFGNCEDRYRAKAHKSIRREFDRLYQDFHYFDGNPQGFRMATRLQWVNDEFGYNLTHTQLAATLKYPWTPDRVGKTRDGRAVKKPGVYLAESEVLQRLREALSLEEGARHPLAYLMEAADDISYCLSDIEDALEKNVVRGQDFVTWMRSQLKTSTDPIVVKVLSELPTEDGGLDPFVSNISVLAWYVKFRTDMTNALVREAARLFIEHQSEVLSGSYFDLLDRSNAAKLLLGAVKSFSSRHLYTSRVVRQRELVGFEVTCGILDRFGSILDLDSSDAYDLLTGREVKLDPEHRLLPTLVSFLGKKHLLAYRHAVDTSRKSISVPKQKEIAEWFARAHLLSDYISGMTDDFAIVMFQRLYSGGLRQI